MDREFFNDSFLLTCKTSNCELKELRTSILKISNMLPISTFVTPAPTIYFVNLEVASLELLPVLEFTLEYRLHKSHTSSDGI
jgi:hypothetical protein